MFYAQHASLLFKRYGDHRHLHSFPTRRSSDLSASASDLSSISEQVAASSGEVSSAMVGITAGAEEQATGLRTVHGAVGEMRQRAGEIGESSARVRELGERIAELAGSKREDLGRALSVLLEV